MNRIAILGTDIGYSLSPEIHAAVSDVTGLDIVCDTVDIAENDLRNTVKNLFVTHMGFFVTKPFKQAVKPFCDCGAFDAVNVVRSRDGKAINTDGTGFMFALDRNFVDWRSKVDSALVLGAGGAAWAAVTALIAAGKTTYVLSRSNLSAAKLCGKTGGRLYANQPVELCVNCTSAGVGDDVLSRLCVIPQFKYAYEMYYAAKDTPFTLRCARSGSITATGKDMLIYQAIEGDGFLFDRQFDTQAVFEKVKQITERR